ncbi:Vgb family protein [Nocardioides nitrophenolicus]|uniref:Vgb family protein n=1 Tax=Nocardioides nitrophenolicus TaxID=60489 RepID=UPI00195C59B1|nr:hypothetical protein [Nocardioides nitrophenolicus]MBM7517223.1 virginiamycin B lyase [Nocardioides nitrophenolicus]
MTRSAPIRRKAVAAGVLALVCAGLGLPPAAAADGGGDGGGEPTRLTVAQRTAPRPAARSGAVQVFPVPTSAAGLGRITTAPNGDMWFTERDKNRIGRITPGGVITEYNLPPQSSSDSWVIDLDIDSAGRVWVIWDQGWKISRLSPATLSGTTWTYDYPYGRQIRVGPGAAWASMSFDQDGIVRIPLTGEADSWDANAPECDGALGRGRDGLMWCQDSDNLIQVNAAGNGGVAYPLPPGVSYPYSVATGPTGKVWFGRSSSGTWFTSPGDGDVGWVADNGQVGTIRTGDRTAPRSLVTGADGNVWFTSVGAAKGIGHVNPAGVGAIVQVGNYAPTSLTYGADGAIWFTDETNNSIVRVPRESLWVTNVNVGANSQLIPHAQPPVTAKKKIKADKKRKKATLTVSCGDGLLACSGSVVVKAGKKKVAAGGYAVPAGSSGKVSVKLTKAGRKVLARSRAVKVKVVLTAATGAQSTKKAKLTR